MPGGDYSRINKSVDFNQLNTTFNTDQKHKDATIMRVKNSIHKGQVQMASKTGYTGTHSKLSNRAGKTTAAENLVIAAFKRSTGVKEVPKEVKSIIKADLTGDKKNRTIGKMLGEAQDKWHSTVTKKYSSGKGLEEVASKRNFSPQQMGLLIDNKKLVQKMVSEGIRQAIHENGGKILSEDQAKQVTDQVLLNFVTHGSNPKCGPKGLQAQHHSLIVKSNAYGKDFEAAWQSKVGTLSLTPQKQAILSELKASGVVQAEIEAQLNEQIEKTAGRPLTDIAVSRIVKDCIEKFSTNLVKSIPPEAAKIVAGKFEAMAKAETAEEASNIATKMLTDLQELGLPKSKMGFMDAVSKMIGHTMMQRLGPNATEPAANVHKGCRKIGKHLLERELGQVDSLGTLMRVNNPYSSFTKIYMMKAFPSFIPNIRDDFNEKLAMRRDLMPGGIEHSQGTRHDVDAALRDIRTRKEGSFRKKDDPNTPLTSNSPEIQQVQKQFDQARVDAGKDLIDVIDKNCRENMPAELNTYFREAYQTANDDQTSQHLRAKLKPGQGPETIPNYVLADTMLRCFNAPLSLPLNENVSAAKDVDEEGVEPDAYIPNVVGRDAVRIGCLTSNAIASGSSAVRKQDLKDCGPQVLDYGRPKLTQLFSTFGD